MIQRIDGHVIAQTRCLRNICISNVFDQLVIDFKSILSTDLFLYCLLTSFSFFCIQFKKEDSCGSKIKEISY